MSFARHCYFFAAFGPLTMRLNKYILMIFDSKLEL